MKVFLGGRKTSELLAISPLSGRYRNRLIELEEYVSEFALIKARTGIEIKYLSSLSKIGLIKLSKNEEKNILKIVKNFNISDAEKIKKIEETTKHDLKAVELYLRTFLSSKNSELIHFGLTSEDVNNLAYRIMLRTASSEIIIPAIKQLTKELFRLTKQYKNVPMLARTHGQPAVPTTLGKELTVFASRLSSQLNKLNKAKLTGKLNGAIGNYNALYLAYPKIDWIKFSKKFVKSLGFEPNLVTTQINSFEDVIEYFQTIQRINGIILDLDQDLWRYISDGWLVQTSEKGQVGSSTMPQKINPIDFENSEGNLKLANGIIEVYTKELPVSRLQRDLSNSTIMRNMGVILAHSLLAYKGTLTGLSKISPDLEHITKDLNEDWSILTEALQTILRSEEIKDSYFEVLDKAKAKHFGEKGWKDLIMQFPISKENRDKLLSLNPNMYIGLASKIASIK